jgi:hypothetical protein
MSHSLRYVIALGLTLLTAWCVDSTAEETESHAFTDKKGNAIEAALLSVSPDMKLAKIRRADNREFELPILNLSLDDQQYVKNWLKKNPGVMKYNFDITFDSNFERTKYVPGPKGRYNLKFITEETRFDIKIKNVTRATLTGLTLEYYIIIEHSVYTGPYNDPDEKEPREWLYPFDYWARKNGSPTPEKPVSLSHKKIALADLPYSLTAEVTTDPFFIREITEVLDRDSLNKDTLLGVIVRLTDVDGNEISVKRSSEHKFLQKSWDELSQMPPGSLSGRPSKKQPDNN